MALDIAAHIPARIQHKGRSRKVRLVVIHATQSQERKGAARAVARYFAGPDAKGSAHVTCDNAETVQSVYPQDTAAGAPGANEDGWHIEQVGYSEQGEAEWLDAYSEAVIARAAQAARWGCEHFGLPKVWLTVQDVRDGKAGITDHVTITKATGKGSHWDPGPHYPRGRFMALVNEEDDMPLSDDDINRIAAAVESRLLDDFAHQGKGDTARRDTIAALFRRILGVPEMADNTEQHKADEDTGRRFQRLLGDDRAGG